MPSYRVLVVDDNHEVRRMVTASIKTLGAEIDVLDVPSAEEALFISASLPLDLVVLDYRLPGMTGLDMVKRLRKRKPDMKIILVTGVEDEASRQQVAKANVAAYFFKPIEIATFLDAVKQCLWVEQSKASLQGIVSAPVPSPIVSEAPAVKSEAPAVKSKAPPMKSETPAIKAVAPVVRSEAPVEKSTDPAVIVVKPITASLFTPTFGERLTALKGQVSAGSVVLVNEVGQIVERAGAAEEFASNSSLLPALMDTFRASHRVADAFGKQEAESLACFTHGKQHIYLTPVDPSNVLLVFISGYIEPDKLGMLDRAIHLAAKDLRMLLEKAQEADQLKQASVEVEQADLPAEVIVDQATLAGVADMFSKAAKAEIKEEADGFWEPLEDNSASDRGSGTDALSFEEARKLGLALDEAQGS